MSRSIFIIPLAVLAVFGFSPRSGLAESGSRPSTQVEEDISLLGQLLECRNVLRAQTVAERLTYQTTDAGPELKGYLSKLDRELVRQKVEIGDDYLWAKGALTQDSAWKDVLKRAERHYARSLKGKGRMIVLRIWLENPEDEEWTGIWARNISTFNTDDDGCCGYERPRHGEFIILGQHFERAADNAEIMFETMRHASGTLKIELSKEGVVAGGDVMIRSGPDSQRGWLLAQVVAEGDFPLDKTVVRIGRRSAHWEGGYPLQPEGTCTINRLVAGPCELYAEIPDLGRSLCQKVEIKPGQKTPVELNVYAQRQVEIEWKYRRPSGEGPWRSGSSTVLTGRSAPLNTWETNGSVYTLSDWDGAGAGIRGMNGSVAPADPADFDTPQVRDSWQEMRSRGRQAYPIEVGKVFALRYAYSRRDESDGEAVIRIRKIEPIGIPPANSSR